MFCLLLTLLFYSSVLDLIPSRLEFAKTYASDIQLLLDRPEKGEPNIEYARRTSVQIIKKLGHQADTVLDCTGAETCVQMTVLVCNKLIYLGDRMGGERTACLLLIMYNMCNMIFFFIYLNIDLLYEILANEKWWVSSVGGFGSNNTNIASG